MEWEKTTFTVFAGARPEVQFSFFNFNSVFMMKASKQLTLELKTAVLELRKAGLKQSQIARQLGFSKNAISNFLRRYDATGDVNRKKGSGKPPKSTKEEDEVLKELSLNDRFHTANELRKDWKDATGVDVSKSTVNRRLISLDLPAMKPQKKPLLNEGQRRRRLEFAMRYRHWTVRDWKRVIFTDETWMELFCHQGNQFVRRRKGEEMKPECLVKTVKHPAKIMCWGGIAPDGTTSLVWIDSSCNAKKYIETIGKAKLASFVQKHPHPRPLLMEDGAPCHWAIITKQWHAARGIRLLENWPGNSPDLNPIKNCWGLMNSSPKAVSGQRYPCPA